MDVIKEFIRKNLFLTVLGAGVVVIGAVVLIVWWLPNAADNTKRVTAVGKEYKSLSTLGSQGVNQAQLAALKESQGEEKQANEALGKLAGELNRGDRQPWEIDIDRERVALFPADAATYRRHGIPLLFRTVYAEEMKKVLASLNGTDPASQEEVALNAERMISRRAQELLLQHLPNQEALVLPPGVDPPVAEQVDDPGLVLPPIGPRVRPRRGAPFGPGESEESEIPRVNVEKMERRAMDDLKARKAREGQFYANQFSLTEYPLPTDVAPTLAQMWKAYINLLLHQHIARVILDTNRGAADPSNKNNIENVVIKRLVRVEFAKVGDGSEFLYEGEITPPVAGSYAARGGGDSITPTVATLTQHTCNQLYDVVPFSFTVVIDSRQIDRFLREVRSVQSANAKERRRPAFFTILKVSTSEPGAGPARTVARAYSGDGRMPVGGPTATPPPEEMFYYGSAPVTQVTVTVEATFLTDWSRDLMPVDMLKRLPTSALREKDTKRAGIEAGSGLGI